jgi:DHA2 family multidrug resistance protein
MQVSEQEVREGRKFEYKWIVATVVIFGAFMSVLDQTIVNVAIPRLQHIFQADLNGIQWVLTGYILTQGVITPTAPFFASRLGNKRCYLLALTLFTLGSALCGLAWNLPSLIAFRLLQGVGAAFLAPLSLTLLYSEFPVEQRGLATGLFGIAALLAPAVGPTLGGYLVTYISWQFIFFVNIPVGLIAILVGGRLLRTERPATKISFDIPGFLLVASGLTSLLYAFSLVSNNGWSSPRVLGLLIGGIILLAIFITIEWSFVRRGKQALVDVRLFANGPFSMGNIVNIFVTFAFFGGLFLFPVYLQNLRSLSAFQAGLLLLPQAIASMTIALLGGRLVDRIGVRFVVLPGLLILALATWLFSTVTLTTPFWELQSLFILRGIAIGLTLQPLIVGTLSGIAPPQIAQASSLVTVIRFIATSLGIAILATLVQVQTRSHLSVVFNQREAQLLAIQDALKLSFIVVIAALVTLFFLHPQRRTRTRSFSADSTNDKSGAPLPEPLVHE